MAQRNATLDLKWWNNSLAWFGPTIIPVPYSKKNDIFSSTFFQLSCHNWAIAQSKIMKEIVFFLMLFSVTPVFSQNQSDTSKIKGVENNLITFVQIKGFKSWNIFNRMKYYNVQGVSIAGIKDYKVDWAKEIRLSVCCKVRLI
ncbi:MAG: hypothetical protein IPL23_08760 [Saprospiraceae bacterium]|nr:hypothetical protein [Saprospiraceae bacterium]